MLTIMASLSQEESRSISENVAWGRRKQFADGKVSVAYKTFLGYERGDDGRPRIVESEAKIVRQIYKSFLEGTTPTMVARNLTRQGIPAPGGKQKWYVSTVLSTLENEKYKGDAILQKTFTVDFLSKRIKVNEGEVPQYYVENSHPAIVPPEVFDLVQHELKRQRDSGRPHRCENCFSGRIVCAECGGIFGSKVWHSNDKYRRIVWRCNNRTRGVKRCTVPHLYEPPLKQAFVLAFNELIQNKAQLLRDYEEILRALTDTDALEKQAAKLREECEFAAELLRKAVDANAHVALDQDEYQRQYASLAERYETVKKKLERLTGERLDRIAKRERILRFLAELQQQEYLLTEFDEALWSATVETMTVSIPRALPNPIACAYASMIRSTTSWRKSFDRLAKYAEKPVTRTTRSGCASGFLCASRMRSRFSTLMFTSVPPMSVQ